MDPLVSFDLTGRVAIVTGGGRLGRAMSVGLASVGAKVVATGRTEADLRSVVDEVEAAGGEALAVVADIGDLADGARIIAATLERFAGIDILVNNAVEAGFSTVAQLTSELWDRAYNVNVKGPVFLCNAALPYLERSAHAAIVNVVSPAMWIGGPNMALYRATKSALWGMSVVMSKEWGPKASASTDSHLVRSRRPTRRARVARMRFAMPRCSSASRRSKRSCRRSCISSATHRSS